MHIYVETEFENSQKNSRKYGAVNGVLDPCMAKHNQIILLCI